MRSADSRESETGLLSRVKVFSPYSGASVHHEAQTAT